MDKVYELMISKLKVRFLSFLKGLMVFLLGAIVCLAIILLMAFHPIIACAILIGLMIYHEIINAYCSSLHDIKRELTKNRNNKRWRLKSTYDDMKYRRGSLKGNNE